MKRWFCFALSALLLGGCTFSKTTEPEAPSAMVETGEEVTLPSPAATELDLENPENWIDPYDLPDDPAFWAQVEEYLAQIQAVILDTDEAAEDFTPAQAVEMFQQLIYEDLTAEATYYYPDWDTMEQITVETTLTQLILEESGDAPYENLEFTIFDLNGDGIPECIIRTPPSGTTYILRAEPYGAFIYEWVFRGMNPLRQDGTMGWSAGAAYNGDHQIRFTERGYETIDLLDVDSNFSPWNPDSLGQCECYVLNEPVDLTMAVAVSMRLHEILLPEQEWYDFSVETFAAQCAAVVS